jgi:tyrosyl-tRNA synthetase
MTAPLIVRADGTKFGKSEGDNVWLSAERTSPYRMYQFFLNVPDSDVEMLLLRLTTLPVDDCRRVAAAHHERPDRREGQRRLAREVTSMVHGTDVLDPIERASGVLFGAPLSEAQESSFELLAQELPTTRIPVASLEGLDPVELFTRAGLARSKGEVRRNPGGYHLNQSPLTERADGSATPIGRNDLRYGRFVLLRRGKTAHHLVVAD